MEESLHGSEQPVENLPQDDGAPSPQEIVHTYRGVEKTYIIPREILNGNAVIALRSRIAERREAVINKWLGAITKTSENVILTLVQNMLNRPTSWSDIIDAVEDPELLPYAMEASMNIDIQEARDLCLNYGGRYNDIVTAVFEASSVKN